ncbi:sensor histidine kinase [Cohnella hashimotonis]|uniref:Sensor histidine kinase n=1 Tax=Cohnella hashimotonis TaxID=2826895 RepID=A0ABT6TK27_9BACL|nr:sensor histidine kinase [Cohnella hashimotonis]MDI4647188.1 sensor histidine kinase [Cohnella hashimotonis]
MRDEVGLTTLRLVKQNHATLEKTLSAVSDKTVTLLDTHFFSDDGQYRFWTNIETLGQMREADAVLERWSSDGTEYSLYMTNKEGKSAPFDLSNKTRGFKYITWDTAALPDWAARALKEKGGATLLPLSTDGGAPTVSLVRAVLNPKAYDDTLGFLVVSRLEALLKRDLVSVGLASDAGIYLFNDSGEPLIQVGDEPLDMRGMPDRLQGETEGYFYDKRGGEELLYAFSRRSAFGTRLVYQIPLGAVADRRTAFQWIIMAASAIYLLCVFAFVLYLLRIVVRPLVRLTKITRIYEPGKRLEADEDLLRGDEFGILYGAFLKMTDRLDRSIEENYVIKIQQRENELAALHSQITPHLLYNTLDSIYWYALDSGNSGVGDMVKDLSKLLRIGLSKGKTEIPIGEELEHAQAYCRLQMKRYPDTFEARWEVDDALLTYMTPKVILQPLVENAIFHSVSSMDGEGLIVVRARRYGDDIRLEVEDNGFLPVDLERMDRILSGEERDKGYGIRNVHERVRLHFGEAYGLHYERPAGSGLRAVVTIPARDGGD